MQNKVIIHNEPMKSHSTFIKFETDLDKLKSTSSAGLTYLRVELERIRFGMSDFLVRIATPKTDQEKSNTIVTLRGNRNMAKNDGLLGTARVVIREMQNQGDQTYDWGNANTESVAKLLAGPVKIFAVNTNIELLKFATDAL